VSVIVISPSNVVTFPRGGGHFWVYMQYVQGLRQLGCDVYWLERFQRSKDRQRDEWMLATFLERMERYGLGGKVILYTAQDPQPGGGGRYGYIGSTPSEAEALFRRADLLLNFHYDIDAAMLARFQHTALVDIDPGLLQFWISVGQLDVSPHDRYFTIGETVGTPSALFSDCGLPWIYSRPPVCLELWPYAYDPDCRWFTTVSSWWGGAGKGEFVTDGQDILYENNKRVTFLAYAELPRLAPQALELALNLGEGDVEQEPAEQDAASPVQKPGSRRVTDYTSDARDRQVLESCGWRIRQATTVAGSPEQYQSYIQQSRGEYSCVKPSCLKFQNAWVSDRTLCYLASGKPVVVQHTGPSAILPSGAGMYRFACLQEAVEALAAINADYQRHCQAAREIVETHFDSRPILERLLNLAH
jgi:hypothetical protein